jgi:hypothetical protein
MLQGFLGMSALEAVVAEGEGVLAMVQGMDLARALGMVEQVDLVELMLVEVAAVEVVEGDKMEDLGMVLAQVLGMVRLVDMGLVVDHMLTKEVKVVVVAADKTGVLGLALALALGLFMVKPVCMGHMVEGRMLKEVDKVEAAAVDKMADQEVVLALVLVLDKLVNMSHMVKDMLREVARVDVVAADKMVGLDEVPA